jgi:hypothetical protein
MRENPFAQSVLYRALGFGQPCTVFVVSKSVANPWRDPKIAVLACKKRPKVGFVHGVDSRHLDRLV